jgi:hypothetical protein
MNSKLFLGFCLAALFAAVQMAWTTPIKLTESSSDSTFPQIYTDPTTKISHLLWIDNKGTDFKLAYAKMFFNRTKSPTIFIETAHRARLSHIIGEGDGKHLLVTFDAKRTQGDNNACAGGVSTGCYEIFFTESKDGGATWSTPVMIQHSNPSDVIDRKGPRMIYVKESKQVFITYWKGGPMAYTTRLGDNGAFSKEALFPWSETTAYESIAYTLNDLKAPVFHFVYVNWSYPEEHIMFTQSSDAGKTWTNPVALEYYKHSSTSDSFFRPFLVANEAIAPKSLFMGFILNNEAHLKWSNDNGKTWSRTLPTHKGAGIAPRVQLCPALKGKYSKLFLLYGLKTAQQGNYYVAGSLDLKDYSYKDEETPFAGYPSSWDYMFDCYEDGSRNALVAVLEHSGADTTYISLSYNDIKPTLLREH